MPMNSKLESVDGFKQCYSETRTITEMLAWMGKTIFCLLSQCEYNDSGNLGNRCTVRKSDRQRWESGLKNRCGRACHFWSEQPSRLAPKRPNLKLSAQILSLLFADKLFVICIPKDG